MAKGLSPANLCRWASGIGAALAVALAAVALSSEFRRCVLREAALGILFEKLYNADCGLWPALRTSCASSFFLSNVLVVDQCLPMNLESRPALAHRVTFLRVLAAESTAVQQGLAALGLDEAAVGEALRQPSAQLRHGWWPINTHDKHVRSQDFAHPRQFPSWWVPGLKAQAKWPRDLFDWIPRVEQAHADILSEFIEINRLEGLSSFNLPEWDGEKTIPSWKTLHLVDQRGGVIDSNVAKMPKTWAVLQSIPRVCLSTMAMFSVMMPGGLIHAHTGYTNLVLRVHLTIINKQPDLAFIEVGGERFGWKEGEAVIFDDSFWHAAWNDGDHPRVVLFFDIWHPSISDSELPAIREAYDKYNRSPIMLGRQKDVQAAEAASERAPLAFD